MCLPRCARCDVTGTAQLGARAVVQWCLPQLRLPTASSCAVPGRRALTSRPGTQPRCGPGCNPRRLRRRRPRFPRKLSVLIRYSNIKRKKDPWITPLCVPSGPGRQPRGLPPLLSTQTSVQIVLKHPLSQSLRGTVGIRACRTALLSLALRLSQTRGCARLCGRPVAWFWFSRTS